MYARWYRLRSYFHKRNKSQDIMDVNANTVIEVMQQYQATRLIHGHTHRPAVHDLDIAGQKAQRFVLAEWKKKVLVYCAGRQQVINILKYNSSD